MSTSVSITTEKAETLVSALIEFSKHKPLQGAEQLEAKKRMRELRRRAWTSKEISDATGGAYSPLTVKDYTAGIKSEDGTEKEGFGVMFADMLANFLTLEDIKHSKEMQAFLDKHQFTLARMVHIAALEGQGVDFRKLGSSLDKLEKFGITAVQAPKVADFIEGLPENLGPADLEALSQAKAKFGSSADALEAVKTSMSIEDLKRQKEHLNKEVEAAKGEVESQKSTLGGVLQQKIQVQDQLDDLAEITKMGFTRESLADLRKVASQNGGSFEKTVEVVSMPDKALELKNQVQEYKQNLVNLTEQKAVLSGQVEAMKTDVQATFTFLKSVLNDAAKKGAEDIASTVQKQSDELSKLVTQYIEFAVKAATFKEDLEFARTVHAIRNFPDQMPKVALHYALEFLELAAKVLRSRSLNPRIKQGDVETSILGLIDLARLKLDEVVSEVV